MGGSCCKQGRKLRPGNCWGDLKERGTGNILHVKRSHRAVEGQLRTFLTWAVAGNKWSIWRPVCLFPDKKNRHLVSRRLGGHQRHSRRFRKEEKCLAPTGIWWALDGPAGVDDRIIQFWVIKKETGLHGQYLAGSGLKQCQDIANRWWLHKMRGTSWQAEDVLTFQNRLCPPELHSVTANMVNAQTCDGARQTIYMYIILL